MTVDKLAMVVGTRAAARLLVFKSKWTERVEPIWEDGEYDEILGWPNVKGEAVANV